MSVLSCARRGCNNIMCDRLSYKFGYICDHCFEELVNLGPDVNIVDFMNSEPNEIEVDTSAAYKRYNAEFPSTWENEREDD